MIRRLQVIDCEEIILQTWFTNSPWDMDDRHEPSDEFVTFIEEYLGESDADHI